MTLILWILSLLSPVLAIIGAAVLFSYRRRRVSALAYALVIAVVAVGGYFVGMVKGIDYACAPPAGNLCGLDGLFVYGPLASSLAILAVGALVLFVAA
jgi:hypothetical protein